MATRGYDYAYWRSSIVQMLGVGDPNGAALFAAIETQMINYAELRIYRELQLLDTSDSAPFPTVALNRSVTIPADAFIIISDANIILPAGALPDAAGSSRRQLIRTSRAFLDFACSAQSEATVPSYYDIFQTTEILLGPVPDQIYQLELLGTIRPLPLGDASGGTSTTTTILTTEFPDLFTAASMIYASGYTKNYGQQSDDPKMAMSWEAVYQGVKNGASMEEMLKKGMAPGATTS